MMPICLDELQDPPYKYHTYRVSHILASSAYVGTSHYFNAYKTCQEMDNKGP